MLVKFNDKKTKVQKKIKHGHLNITNKGDWQWSPESSCGDNAGKIECYFLPISNCDATNILKNTDASKIATINKRKDKIGTKAMDNPKIRNARVIHLIDWGWPGFSSGGRSFVYL